MVLSPTIFTVDDPGNSASGSGPSGTLPYVISQANANPSADGSEIEFDSSVFNSSSPQTITLASTLVLSETAGPEVIDGPGAGVVTVSGGGKVQVFAVDSGVTASLAGLTISGGSTATSGSGAGVENDGTATLTDCTISGNSTGNDGYGGGLGNDGTATLTGCTIMNNYGENGGGINNAGTATLINCTVSNNSAFAGGGISSENSITLTNCTVSSNSSTGLSSGGGGLAISNSATLTNCTVSGNSSDTGGGGINTLGPGTTTLTNCTVSGNTAKYGFGGGISTFNMTTTLNNCTISGNFAGGGGGGVDSGDGAGRLTTLTNCTVTGNSAGNEDGGLFSDEYTVLQNTIVAGNTYNGSPSDIGESVDSSSSFNLIGTGGSGGLVNGINGNIVGVANPGLDPNGLQNNGGPTQTIALMPDSPALDAGSPAFAFDPSTGLPLTTDQRGAGFARIVNSSVDIGAFQDQGPGISW